MSKSHISALVAVGAGLIFCGALAAKEGDGNDRAKNLITVRLEPSRYNAGRIGNAILVPVGDKTGVTLTLSGVPAYTSRPIHLYSYLVEGSCESKNSGQSYALTRQVLAESLTRPNAIAALRGPVRMTDNVAVPFEKLRATPFAIRVRLSPTDGNHEIFCGNIPS